MQVKKQQLDLDREQWTGSKLGKECVKVVYCHPVYLTYMQSTSCEMPGWMKLKLGSRLQGEISITSDTQMTPPLMAESKEELKMKVKEESEKIDLNLSIQEMKINTSRPITSRQIDGESMETVTDFILEGSKITADGYCSHEIERRLLFGRKIMTNLNSIFKSREIRLPTNVHLIKAMIFPAVKYGCDSWAVKKAEH